MKKTISLSISTLTFSLLSTVNAGVITTPVDDGNSLWVMTDDTQQVAISQTPTGYYSGPAQKPSWGIAQWNSPVPFTYPYPQTIQPNGNWVIANNSARIAYDKTSYPYGVFEIATNGQYLPCHDWSLYINRSEYDLFLVPKADFLSMGPNAAGAPNGMSISAPLSTLNGLAFNLGLEITYEDIGTNCSVSQAGYLLGFTFYNTSKEKFFFYQITFRLAQRDGEEIIMHYPDAEIFYDTFTDQGGVDDHVRNIANGVQAPNPHGGRVAYSLNILPRLSSIIRSGGPGGNTFDKDLSHYILVGIYIGPHIWAHTYTTSKWDNFNIVTW